MVFCGGGLGCVSKGQRKADHQAEAKEIYLTGSYLPQEVEIHGPVTNGKDNVRVVDRSEIERTGGSDVIRTLRMLGATR
jgi:hypothetical protein